MNKILLIEDNNEVRENTAEILELANYSVLTAANGKLGVELAQGELPDLIVCDIMMPVLDGYGVLHLLSKNPKTASIPFIFLTAKAERTELRKGMEMGADDYITKPFDDIELLNAIESRLRKSSLMKKDFPKNTQGINAFIDSAKSFADLKNMTDLEKGAKNYSKKETIYKEDGYPKGIFYLAKGKVKTFRTHELGKEFITGLYKEGDFFGYLALMEEQQYPDTAVAMDESEIWFISKEDFFSLLYINAEVSKTFIRLLSDNLAEKEKQLVNLAYNSVRKKVADALVTLHNRYKKDENLPFSMNISRDDLANISGTATETAIRTLSDFKEEGLIAISGGTIEIKNLEKLIKMRN